MVLTAVRYTGPLRVRRIFLYNGTVNPELSLFQGAVVLGGLAIGIPVCCPGSTRAEYVPMVSRLSDRDTMFSETP